jgi:hypothetical protein
VDYVDDDDADDDDDNGSGLPLVVQLLPGTIFKRLVTAVFRGVRSFCRSAEKNQTRSQLLQPASVAQVKDVRLLPQVAKPHVFV